MHARLKSAPSRTAVRKIRCTSATPSACTSAEIARPPLAKRGGNLPQYIVISGAQKGKWSYQGTRADSRYYFELRAGAARSRSASNPCAKCTVVSAAGNHEKL